MDLFQAKQSKKITSRGHYEGSLAVGTQNDFHQLGTRVSQLEYERARAGGAMQ